MGDAGESITWDRGYCSDIAEAQWPSHQDKERKFSGVDNRSAGFAEERIIPLKSRKHNQISRVRA